MEYFLTTVKRKKYIFVINVGESDSKYFFYSPHQSQSVIGDEIKTQLPSFNKCGSGTCCLRLWRRIIVGTSVDMSAVWLAWAWLSSSHHQHCLERSPGLTGPGHPHWLISGGRINLGLASSNSGKYAMMGDWWNIRWGMSGIGWIVLWLADRGGKPSDVMTSHHNYRHGTSNYIDK